MTVSHSIWFSHVWLQSGFGSFRNQCSLKINEITVITLCKELRSLVLGSSSLQCNFRIRKKTESDDNRISVSKTFFWNGLHPRLGSQTRVPSCGACCRSSYRCRRWDCCWYWGLIIFVIQNYTDDNTNNYQTYE